MMALFVVTSLLHLPQDCSWRVHHMVASVARCVRTSDDVNDCVLANLAVVLFFIIIQDLFFIFKLLKLMIPLLRLFLVI
jgi:hypothetical protein